MFMTREQPTPPNDLAWQIPPECQGQTVEVSYASDCSELYWRRHYDRSNCSTSYAYCSFDDAPDAAWEPWNGTPSGVDWTEISDNHTAACQLGAECECRPARFDSITDLSLALDSFNSLEFEALASFEGFVSYAWQHYNEHPVFDRDLLLGLYLRQAGLRPVDYLDSHVHNLLFGPKARTEAIKERLRKHYEEFVPQGGNDDSHVASDLCRDTLSDIERILEE